jgi:hypothetical protein
VVGGYRGYGGYYGGRFYGGYGLGFGLGFGYGYGWPYYGYGYGSPYYGYGGYGYPYYDPYYSDPYGYGGGSQYYGSPYGGAGGYAAPYAQQPAQQYAQPPAAVNQNVPAARTAQPSIQSYYQAPDFYLIAFDDHTIRAALTYRVEGGQILWTSREHEEKSAPLASVDRRFTEQINRDRHVEFRLP